MATLQAPRLDATMSRVDRPLDAALLVAGPSMGFLLASDGGTIVQATATLIGLAAAWLLVTALRRVGARWSGWLLSFTGIGAVAVAVGFAPYLVKDGPFMIKAATVVLLVMGLLLVGGGVVRASAGSRMWVRLLAGLAALVTMLLTVSVVSPAVAATHVPRPAIGSDPSSVGLSYDDVRIQTTDDVTLAAWYTPSRNGGAVVLLHGAGSTRSNVLDEAAVLAEHGFGVLMLDARGHGDSEGRAMDFGWAGDADITAATAYLAGRDDVEDGRIGLVGMSMGGEEAIGAADAAGVRAVVSEGATTRTALDESWLSDEYGLRGAVQEQIEKVQDLATALFADVPRPASLRDSVERATDTEFLLVTAGEMPDESHAATYIQSAAPSRIDVWTVDGAGHIGGLATAPHEWESQVTGFLEDTLLG
jgi:dienelactone hydrolase